METQELLMTALRTFGIYVLLLVVIRLSGKRTIGNHSAFDLLIALVLGEVTDEIIYGDVDFIQGSLPIIVMGLLHQGNSWLTYWDHGFDRILEGTPTVIVRDGKLDRKGLRTERLNEKDAMELLRLHEIDDLREVKIAMMENDGELSVIKHSWAEPVQKGDLGGEEAKEKKGAVNGHDEPPPEKLTYAGRYIGTEE